VKDISNFQRAVIGSDHYLVTLKFIASSPKSSFADEKQREEQFNDCLERKLSKEKETW
jgi:hypothetical protein